MPSPPKTLHKKQQTLQREQGCVAAPAEGVGVAVRVAMVQQSPLVQVVHDLRVGVFDKLTGKGIVAGDDTTQTSGGC